MHTCLRAHAWLCTQAGSPAHARVVVHTNKCLRALARRYALGFIYANHGHDIQPFLLESLRGSSNEITQHGTCLGLGARLPHVCVCVLGVESTSWGA